MRSIVAVLFAVVAVSSAAYLTKDVKYADKAFLVKQKVFFDIFRHVMQDDLHTVYYEDSKKFDIYAHADYYTNAEAYTEFIHYFKEGFLDTDELYNPTIYEQKMQTMALFKLFYYAKDWESFYSTMVWARYHFQYVMFTEAVYMVVFHKAEFAGIVLPAIYETNPYHFFNSYVVSKSQKEALNGMYNAVKVDDYHVYTVEQNFTDYYMTYNYDAKLSYFTEDIGLNSYYYYFNMDYPAYLGGKEFGLYKDRRGEFFLYQHQQFLARYYLERLTNNLGMIPEFDFYKPIETGYYASMSFYNGVNFPTRENFYMMYLNKFYYQQIAEFESYEHRIFEAIDLGYFLMPNGEHIDLRKPESIEYLGNLIQKNYDSMGNMYYYGMLEVIGKKMLGGSFQKYDYYKHSIPSFFELYETAMRDPMFYQFYKRIFHFTKQWQSHLPEYKHEELFYEGVKITSVTMDKLITYFDKFEADITNVVDAEVKNIDVHKSIFKVHVPRLNHIPFKFNLNVQSTKAEKAVVVMFVGPKYDEYGNIYDIEENRENFYQLEHFIVDLVAGDNVITRNSQDFSWFVEDRTTYFDLYKHLMSAIDGKEKFPLDMTEAHCGFPSRLMLPRGKLGGFGVQFFFMVAPYHAPGVAQFTGYDKVLSCGVGSGARNLDTLPFGFPFDREIKSYKEFMQPNMYFFDTNIYAKSQPEFKIFY